MRTIEDLDINLEEIPEGPLKRVVLFNDISGFGKCSVTTSLPILSAAGIEGAVVPTAILSTHTGNFEGFTFRDLTQDLPDFLGHWNDLEIHFDVIYSGYLGSPEQARILRDFILKQREKNPDILTYIDPVMGDNGKLYTGYGIKMVEAIRELLPLTDILLPNLTEAFALIGEDYEKGPYSEEQIKKIARKLSKMGPKIVIITGIPDGEKILTAVFFDNHLELIAAKRAEGRFHGTGDIFASFTLAGLLNGLSVLDAAELGAYLTYGAAKRTELRKTPRRDGVDFEGMIPVMLKKLQEKKNENFS